MKENYYLFNKQISMFYNVHISTCFNLKCQTQKIYITLKFLLSYCKSYINDP